MGCGLLLPLFLIGLGAWIWTSNYGIRLFNFYRDWPIVLVLVGIYILVRLGLRRSRSPRD